MSRFVTHDGLGQLKIRFPFDRGLVDRIKSLPQRRWNAEDRYWSVPEVDVVPLVELLRSDNFEFDEATQVLYRESGGTATLAASRPQLRSPSPLPGLFDDPTEDGSNTTPESGAGVTTDYSVSQLNEQVKRVLDAAFPNSVWLVGEVSGFNKGAHRKHVGFHLIEHDEQGRKVSEVSATLFDRTRQSISAALAAAGDPFQLEDEIQVRVRAHVELYVPWGSYRVIVEELDVRYTLGEAARRREEILRRLGEAGLLEVNSQLPLPALPLRVGLITSLGSDAYNDVLRTLQESGYAFRMTAHGARVQGHQTEPSVLNALDWFRERSDEFDVVLICRGGGSRTDLAWFDSEPLGRAVAGFPLPAIIGIGHEQDRSVLDEVGRRAKTPTAAAGFLVETVRETLERFERSGRAILDHAADRLRGARRAGDDRAQRLAAAASSVLMQHDRRLAVRRERLVLGARLRLGSGREALVRFSTLIPSRVGARLQRDRGALDSSWRAVSRGASNGIEKTTVALDRVAGAFDPAASRMLIHESERLGSREARARLIDPKRVVERGYSILRRDDGRVVASPDLAPSGTALEAETRGGRLQLRSEGPVTRSQGGDSES